MTWQRIGAILVGLGFVSGIGIAVESMMKGWKHRWVMGALVVGLLAIGGSIWVGGFGGVDSDLWFSVALAFVGGLAAVVIILGSRRAGMNSSVETDYPDPGLSLLVATPFVAGGLGLILFPTEGAGNVWVSIGVAATQLTIALTALSFGMERSGTARAVAWPCAIAITALTWVGLSLGAAPAVALVGVAAAEGMLLRLEVPIASRIKTAPRE